EKAREPETRALAAGERAHVAVGELGESQAAEDATDRGVEVVATGVLESMLRVCVPLHHLGIPGRELGLERAKLGLDLAQMRGGAARVLRDRALGRAEQLLLEEADARPARAGHVARVRRLQAGRDP